MFVMGIDPGLRAGIVVLNNDYKLVKEIDWSKEPLSKWTYRLGQVYDRIRALASDPQMLMVAIEGYSFGSDLSSKLMGEVGGVIRLAVYHAKLPWVEIAPTMLKKFVTGKGNATKEQMVLSVYRSWQYEAESHNLADAYGLARMAAVLKGFSGAPSESQKMIVSKLEIQKFWPSTS